MGDERTYVEALKEALDARRAWFDQSEFPKLKEETRVFHTALAAIYNLFVKKGYIPDDPYKNDAKIGELSVPDTSAFTESSKRDQLGQRFSQLESAFDYLVNFYPFNTESFSQGKIRIIIALLRYIDWTRLTPESGQLTEAVSEIITKARRAQGDLVSSTVLNESLLKLEQSSGVIAMYLKTIGDYNRILYKYHVRQHGTAGLSAAEANIAEVKKRFAAACPSMHFYQQVVEEVIKEDYSAQAERFHEAELKKLAIPEVKKKTPKQTINFRLMLIEGLNALGGAGATLAEITGKIIENQELMANRKKGFWDKIKKLVSQMTSKEEEAVIYDLEYIDPAKGTPVKEKLNFTVFSAEIDKKSKILSALAPKGSAEKKLEVMEEAQLIEILQRNIKDILALHKTLSGLDDFFKRSVDASDRSRVRGIKPELSALKNATARGGEKFNDYNAHKESAEQFKRMGIDVET
ncbi:MAG: hypothetical protein LBC77_02745 [Spirochaetaceae bacterium]|jgi:hypothetical protein|nr:hypothetical protein [Spirochaetaceae bacterium]